ncbi:MAG: threonine--tRNA ligase [Phycisphaerales bacterium]|nr:threonine--tRNA ligase [Phycisphaerales bacterium]
MPTVSLPDGSTRSFDTPVRVLDVASDIGPGLAKAALGGVVDGTIVDCAHIIDADCALQIITGPRGKADPSDEALFLIRHSAAHVMAEAIEDLFPGVQLVYGPPVEGGFYYDIAEPEDGSPRISSDDFDRIEARMREIMAEDRPFTRHVLPVEEGMARLETEGSKYKLDNAQRAVEAGSSTLSWYATGTPGTHWDDLCRGPHVPSTSRIGAVKIMRVAASYWHGDADSDALTRVYGTAFPDEKRLAAHLEQLEEARRRDHRVVGRKLELFAFDEMVGPGLTLWKPRGAVIRETLQQFISEALRRQGYDQVFTPHVGKLDLYRTSGHFPYYADSQFPPLVDREQMKAMATCSCGELSNKLEDGDIDGYLLKPMNCPHHIRIFASEARSYRDLPVRLAEFGTVYRWEQSGELGGLLRVRGFTQDDAHLFCTEDQVHGEVLGCLELVQLIFGTLGIDDFEVRVGLRGPDAGKYVGEASNWDRAEAACRNAAETLGVPYTAEAGEAAFYGPKIDFVVKDTIGRRWQLGTVQVDYNLPERFGLTYTGADNAPHRPVMIHRAPFGSMERFVGFLIEHFDGAFPAWLAPEQVRVLPVSDKSAQWADSVESTLRDAGVRVTQDAHGGRLPNRIREAANWKIPYVLVVGPRDAEAAAVSVRVHGVERDLGAVGLDEFVSALRTELDGHGTPCAHEVLFQTTETA